jgi:hypothetical protein
MHRTFSKHRFDTPGRQDIFDYQIGDLWKRDIDGFETTVAVIEGQVAPPEMMRALEYVSSRRLANAISISDGTGESTCSHGREEITAQDPGELAAAVPDITMDAQDGTSEAAPLFAGVLALATQLNHADVGPVNPALYGILGPAGARAGITDVVSSPRATRPTCSTRVSCPGIRSGCTSTTC